MRSEFLWLARCSQPFMIRSIILTIPGGIFLHMDVHNLDFLCFIISVVLDSFSKPQKNIGNFWRVNSMHTIVISRSQNQYYHLLLTLRYQFKKPSFHTYHEILSSSTRTSRIVLRRKVLIRFLVLHRFLRNQPRMRQFFFVWISPRFLIMIGENIPSGRLSRVTEFLILPNYYCFRIGGGFDFAYFHSRFSLILYHSLLGGVMAKMSILIQIKKNPKKNKRVNSKPMDIRFASF